MEHNPNVQGSFGLPVECGGHGTMALKTVCEPRSNTGQVNKYQYGPMVRPTVTVLD